MMSSESDSTTYIGGKRFDLFHHRYAMVPLPHNIFDVMGKAKERRCFPSYGNFIKAIVSIWHFVRKEAEPKPSPLHL